MKIAVVTNILTPYRCVFFDKVSEVLKERGGELNVYVMTDALPLRPWSYEILKRDYCFLMKGQKVLIRGQDYLDNPSIIKDVLNSSPDVIILAGSWTYMTTWRLVFSKTVRQKTKLLFWTESHTHTAIGNQSREYALIKALKKMVIQKFDGFLVPGEYARVAIMSIVQDKPFIRLPNLVDNTYYNKVHSERAHTKVSLRIENHIDENVFLFFTPARLTKVKGLVQLFNNLSFSNNRKKVVFAIAGEGELGSELKEITRRKGIHLLLLGYQQQEDIAKWLTMADAFLLPSLSDPNPLSNIEAAWSGLPLCVSCYVGNQPELVEDDVNGVVFDTLNAENVSSKICSILQKDKSWLIKAGKISHKKAEDGFDSEKEVPRLLDEIQSFLIE